MTAATVLAGSLLGLCLAACYVGVGVGYGMRARAEKARTPHAFFTLFWVGIGAYGLLDAAWSLAVLAGVSNLAFATAALHLKVALGVLAFYGIVQYLLLVYTDDWRTLPWVTLFYMVVFLVVTYFYVWQGPRAETLVDWNAQLVYAKPHGAFWDVVVALLFVPPALAAVAYAFLLRRAKEPRQRARILAVSLSLVVFFGGVGLAWLAEDLPWWGLAEKLLGLGTAVTVLAALRYG